MSLRDIDVCLSAQVARLCHIGFRREIKRSTLADANKTRVWRIHAVFAQCLIAPARKLNIGDCFGVELENTAYALDSATIALCLSLFPREFVCTTKSAVEMHTLLDLRGNIPSFIHLPQAGHRAPPQEAASRNIAVRIPLPHTQQCLSVVVHLDLPFAHRYLGKKSSRVAENQ